MRLWGWLASFLAGLLCFVVALSFVVKPQWQTSSKLLKQVERCERQEKEVRSAIKSSAAFHAEIDRLDQELEKVKGIFRAHDPAKTVLPLAFRLGLEVHEEDFISKWVESSGLGEFSRAFMVSGRLESLLELAALAGSGEAGPIRVLTQRLEIDDGGHATLRLEVITYERETTQDFVDKRTIDSSR